MTAIEQPKQTLLEQFQSARRVSTPIVAIRTPDPKSTLVAIAKANESSPIEELRGPALVIWDIVSGLQGANKRGQDALKQACGDKAPAIYTAPVNALNTIATKLPENSILFLLNAQRFLSDRMDPSNLASVVQAIWNVRDQFKKNFRCLVLLGAVLTLPPELTQDVMLLDEPYPDADALEAIIRDTCRKAPLDDDTMVRAVSAARGLSAFPAEQVVSMAYNKSKLDISQIWERKFKVVEETPGLSVYRGKETFADVRGVRNIKEFYGGIFGGKQPPDLIVFMDEVEKMFAGASAFGGDTSGVSQQQHGALLKWMENNKVLALMEVGHPGAAKTAIALACAGEFQRPLLKFDIDAAQGRFVGQTGEQTRQALKIIDAMGKPIIIATCNQLASLSPELRRRFQLGTFFFDLPTAEERDAIWKLYLAKYGLDDKKRPDDTDWTGAEIRTCCDLAWRLTIPLGSASNYIVPVSRSSAERVAALREQADGVWISASTPGVYQKPGSAPEVMTGQKRKIASGLN